MRELHYENQGTNTYLVYAVSADDTVDSMSLGMLTNNRIHGLAQTIFTQMDNQKFIKFNVSAKVSVAQFFAGAVNKKRLLGVFTGIVNAMLAAEDYMLDPASIIMDMDYIFTDVSTCETDLICLPVIDMEAKQTDLGMFFRNIMFNTQFDQTENCDHVAKIINYLNGTPLFSLNDFKKLLEEIQEQKTQPIVTKVKPETTPADAGQQQKKQPVVNQAPANQTGGVQPVAGQALKVNNTPANSGGTGMNVPPATKTQPAQQPETTGSEISFFYLMQHYNKENAAEGLKNAKLSASNTIKQLEEESNPVLDRMNADYVLPRELVVGDRVIVFDINKQASVEQLSKDGKKAFVSIGGIKTWTNVSNLRLDDKPQKEKINKKRTVSGIKSKTERDVRYEFDMRGMTADEGIMELDRYIDQAVLSGIPSVTVIHGKGTGVLRKAVHQFLKENRAVKSYRLGVFGEGEAGVTIVEFYN